MCKMQCAKTDQLDRPSGRTSYFYLKPWPVRIFKDFPLSLYIVAASESDEGLVLTRSMRFIAISRSPLKILKIKRFLTCARAPSQQAPQPCQNTSKPPIILGDDWGVRYCTCQQSGDLHIHLPLHRVAFVEFSKQIWDKKPSAIITLSEPAYF